MNLPTISHLQFAVLVILLEGETSGEIIRHRLAEKGVSHTTTAFYQLMYRMERHNLITGYYVSRISRGKPVTESKYQSTKHGRDELNATKVFYDSCR